MKTIKIHLLLTVICVILCNFTHVANAQDNNLYQTTMQKALTKLDNARNVDELMDSRNLFERISNKFTDKWQPLYYTAYCDIQLVYMDQKSDQNKSRLENAKQLLEKLDSRSDADASEVNTLWGYYYNGVIMLNPESAQFVFGKVISSYEKGIELNPENPRPVILRAFFNQFLPSFVKLKIDPKTEVEKAKELFAKEDKSVERPYWGQYFLNQVKTDN